MLSCCDAAQQQQLPLVISMSKFCPASVTRVETCAHISPAVSQFSLFFAFLMTFHFSLACSQIQIQIQLHEQLDRDRDREWERESESVRVRGSLVSLLEKQQVEALWQRDPHQAKVSVKCDCCCCCCCWLGLIIRVQICCVGVASVPAKVTQTRHGPQSASSWLK